MMIVVMLIAIVAAVVIPLLTESKTGAHESSAIGTLRTLCSAQNQFRASDRDGDTYLDFATSIAELSMVGLIDNVVGSGQKSGYVFSLSGSTYEWEASATPIDARLGKRKFFVDTTGVIRFSVTGTPDASSTPIGK